MCLLAKVCTLIVVVFNIICSFARLFLNTFQFVCQFEDCLNVLQQLLLCFIYVSDCSRNCTSIIRSTKVNPWIYR